MATTQSLYVLSGFRRLSFREFTVEYTTRICDWPEVTSRWAHFLLSLHVFRYLGYNFVTRYK